MSKRHLKLEPINISDDVWFYEEDRGLDVHVETHAKHMSIIIPWKDIPAALKRKDKPSQGSL